MCGNYEIIFTCSENQSDKVADYLKHYDFERIDPFTRNISYFSVYGECQFDELNDVMVGLFKTLNVQIELIKFGWMKDE